MTPEGVFAAANLVALAGWALLAALPRVPREAEVLVPAFAGGLLAVLYVFLLASNWGGSEGGFS